MKRVHRYPEETRGGECPDCGQTREWLCPNCASCGCHGDCRCDVCWEEDQEEEVRALQRGHREELLAQTVAGEHDPDRCHLCRDDRRAAAEVAESGP